MRIKLETLGDLRDAEELCGILEGAAKRHDRNMDLRGERLLNKLRDAVKAGVDEVE